MKIGNLLKTVSTLIIALIALLAVGCSSNNPMSNNSTEIVQADNMQTENSVQLLSGAVVSSDIIIKASITSIDHENGTITVETHTETIVMDNNTFIFSKLSPADVNNTVFAKEIPDGSGHANFEFKIKISAEVLEVGDDIAVFANSVDTETLYAVAIELDQASFAAQNEIEFVDFVGNVDVEAGTMDFLMSDYFAYIDESTVLLGYEGETITLDMFFTCETVIVTGTLISETEVQVSMLQKTLTWEW